MHVYFTRLKVGWPDPLTMPKDWDGCWRIYTVCRTNRKISCTTRSDIAALTPNDKVDARTSYISFINKANTGQQLAALYDEKKCHETHSFKWKQYDDSEEKIFRIWGTGDIRINFIYLPDMRIVMLKTWPKRKDNLTKGEKDLLEKLAKEVLDTYESYDFEAREL